MLICPFCRSIYFDRYQDGDTCVHCGVDEIIWYEDYLERRRKFDEEELEDDQTSSRGI
jgi:hypothetical protein